MENDKKLSEELLRIDGIDPANISDTERTMLKAILDKETKHLKRLSSWRSDIFFVIFILAVYGILKFKQVFAMLHIPLITAWPILIIFSYGMLFLLWPKHLQQILQGVTKVERLDFLVHGKHSGSVLVGKKNGKRYIDWLNTILLAIAIWLFMLLGGSAFYNKLYGYSIFYSTSESVLHIVVITITSLPFVVSCFYFALKTPLEELTEIKTENNTYRRRKFSFVTIAVIITAVFIGTHFLGGSSVALADVVKKIEQTTNCVFKKTTIVSSENNNTNTFDSLVYYTKAAIREDIYVNEKIAQQAYVIFSKGIFVGIDHKQRFFNEKDLEDEDIENEKLTSATSPENIVNLILSEGNYTKLGRKIVDGILSEGFEINDKRTLLSMDKDKVENIAIRLWIDVNTNLPIHIEVNATLIDNIKAHVVMSDPQWDVELEADFFEPKIPDNYLKPEERGYIGINLENWPTLKVIPGTAADKAGIKNGDIVLKIDGNIISDIESSADAQNMLIGKIGEKVVLTIQRGEQIITFEIERAALPE